MAKLTPIHTHGQRGQRQANYAGGHRAHRGRVSALQLGASHRASRIGGAAGLYSTTSGIVGQQSASAGDGWPRYLHKVTELWYTTVKGTDGEE